MMMTFAYQSNTQGPASAVAVFTFDPLLAKPSASGGAGLLMCM
jgi:hypothetical protein